MLVYRCYNQPLEPGRRLRPMDVSCVEPGRLKMVRFVRNNRKNRYYNQQRVLVPGHSWCSRKDGWVVVGEEAY